MDTATFLYIVDLETKDDTIRSVAARVRDGHGYLRILLYAPVPILPFNATGAISFASAGVADHWPEEVARAQAASQTRAQELEAILANLGAPGEIRPIFCVLADIKTQVAECTRSADLAIIAQSLRDTPESFSEWAHACLFNSPVGLLLNAPVFKPDGHVFLAWDDGDAASNAAHKALPLLKASREITIGCFDPELNEGGEFTEPGADVAAWLTRHGCSVTLAHYPSGGVELGTSILSKAAELGCDTIVMGAYGHSRMRQALFGGTTRTVLEQTERAVFLAH
ncbi:MAG: universal stress protein [Pseudomonadota bacterium]